MCNRSAQFCLGTRECVKCSDTSHWLSIYNLPSILEKSRITWIMSHIYSPPPLHWQCASMAEWLGRWTRCPVGSDGKCWANLPQTGSTLLRGTYTLNRYKSLVWKECEWLALCAEWCKYARTDQMMIIYVIAGHCRRIFSRHLPINNLFYFWYTSLVLGISTQGSCARLIIVYKHIWTISS